MKSNKYFENLNNEVSKAYLTNTELNWAAGKCDALRCYNDSYDAGTEYLEMSSMNTPWERDMKDFCDTLTEAGIDTIRITSQSTTLMDIMYALEDNGWVMGERYTTKRERYRRTEEVRGYIWRKKS